MIAPNAHQAGPELQLGKSRALSADADRNVRPDAKRTQMGRHLIGLVVEFPIADFLLNINQSNSIGRELHLRLKEFVNTFVPRKVASSQPFNVIAIRAGCRQVQITSLTNRFDVIHRRDLFFASHA